MEPIDFSRYPRFDAFFAGSEKKIGVIINGIDFIVKFQKEDHFGMRNNHISEYIGSHIFNIVGIEAQQTFLGKFDRYNVVACKSFISKGEQFVPFNEVGESTIGTDMENTSYDYQDIMKLLVNNKKLTSVESTIEMFWNIFIIDCLIGNFDRHGSNWGFIKKNNKYRLAPVFDNGSCLFPKIIDEDDMNFIINSKEETMKRVYEFPLSQIKLDNKKSSYTDIIGSLRFEECNDALLRMFPRIDMEKINRFIRSMKEISETQKNFYIHMLRSRYDEILKNNYGRLLKT